MPDEVIIGDSQDRQQAIAFWIGDNKRSLLAINGDWLANKVSLLFGDELFSEPFAAQITGSLVLENIHCRMIRTDVRWRSKFGDCMAGSGCDVNALMIETESHLLREILTENSPLPASYVIYDSHGTVLGEPNFVSPLYVWMSTDYGLLDFVCERVTLSIYENGEIWRDKRKGSEDPGGQ